MTSVDIVAALAAAQFIFFGALVGRARGIYKVRAPAVTGSDGFERIYRVQMNTLELLVVLYPALYLGAKYWSPMYAAIGGAIFIAGRFIYWRAYVTAPEKRSLGFQLSMLPIAILLVAALIGAARAFM